MLEMTNRAATLLTELHRNSDIPDHAGVRVYGESTPDGKASLAIGFTEEPVPGDQVTETNGVKLFVAPEVAAPLQDAVMDVTGDNGGSQLIFRSRADDTLDEGSEAGS